MTIAGASSRLSHNVLRKRGLNVGSIPLRLSLLWIGVVFVVAVAPFLFTADDPTVLRPLESLLGPGDGSLLGTDQYGRSILTLLIYGTRSAIVVGLAASAIGTIVGGGIGLLAGYVGGVVDSVIGRVMDVLMCFPGVLLALIIAAALGPTQTNLVIAVGISTVPGFYRVMRGQVISVRGRLFVTAARSSGFRESRIVARHVLPNALGPTMVLTTVTVGVSIVAAASLSFLGLGPVSTVPDWGSLLAQGQPYLASAWWMSTFPGIALTVTVIAVSLTGDWLRDRLDID